jgi:hypothetical protein
VDVSGTNQALARVVLVHESVYLLEWLHLLIARVKFQLDPSVYQNASALLQQKCELPFWNQSGKQVRIVKKHVIAHSHYVKETVMHCTWLGRDRVRHHPNILLAGMRITRKEKKFQIELHTILTSPKRRPITSSFSVDSACCKQTMYTSAAK